MGRVAAEFLNDAAPVLTGRRGFIEKPGRQSTEKAQVEKVEKPRHGNPFPRSRVVSPPSSCSHSRTLLPKLRVGTHLRDAPLRIPARQLRFAPGYSTGSRASRTCVPKQSLGTRCRKSVPQ